MRASLHDRFAPGNGLDDQFVMAELLAAIEASGNLDIKALPSPEYVYRRKEWDVVFTDFDQVQLLVPANPWRTALTFTIMFPPVNGFAEFTYGYPVVFFDEFGTRRYGMPIGEASPIPSIGFSPSLQITSGTICIDDVYVAVPDFLNGGGPGFPGPSRLACFEQTAEPF